MEVKRQFINSLDHRLSRGDAAKPGETGTPQGPDA
jgi:hypothetical protein